MDATHQSVKVWDLPVRLFHWALVICFAVSWASVELADVFDNAMQIHLYAGYTMLSLVLFRILWGIFGSSTARFSQFVTGLRPTLAYATTFFTPRTRAYIGHNPMGGWAVIAMLVLLGIQVGTGLFAHDDLLTSGPLAHTVSSDLSDTMSDIHQTAFNFLLAMVGIHIAAVLFYRFYKHNDLITTMFTGYKTLPNTLSASNLHLASNARAIFIFLLVVAGVTALVLYV